MARLKTALNLAVLTVALAACASPPARFYALSSVAAPTAEKAVGSADRPSVTVGPVSVPALVDRPQIVVASSTNRVQIDEFNRWASPLAEEIARVVATNLARALPAARVLPYGQGTQSSPDVQVRIDVQQFSSTLGEAVVIEAAWSVRRLAGGTPSSGRSLLREPTNGGDFDSLVAAHSRALARLSAELAAVIGPP